MSVKAKGYVVRCEQESGRPGMPHEYIGEHNTLGEAVADLMRAMPHYNKGRIFAVAEDGTKRALPTYEDALSALFAAKILSEDGTFGESAQDILPATEFLRMLRRSITIVTHDCGNSPTCMLCAILRGEGAQQ